MADVATHRARATLPALLDQAAAGVTTYITTYGRRTAAVVPLAVVERHTTADTPRVGVREARPVFTDLADDAHIHGVITLITRRGNPVAAIAPVDIAAKAATATDADQ